MSLEPQTYWNTSIKNQMSTFVEWVGDSKAMSKIYAGAYCKEKGFRNVADLGCGTATFYTTLQDADPTIRYLGVDSCRFFILNALKQNIPILESDIRDISDLSDSSFDLCFTRHTLEHQPTFREVLREAIRVGRLEACIIFFIKPGASEVIHYDNSSNLYHNQYSITDIEAELMQNPKVVQWTWKELDEYENVLHIQLI